METVEGAPAEHPEHTAVTVKLPPAACGGSRAFQDASGEFHGLNGGRQPGHSDELRLRTPQSGPNVCTVAFSAACTVVGAPLAGVRVTLTTAPAADDAKSRKPYTADCAGACCSTMLSPKAASKEKTSTCGGGGGATGEVEAVKIAEAEARNADPDVSASMSASLFILFLFLV